MMTRCASSSGGASRSTIRPSPSQALLAGHKLERVLRDVLRATRHREPLAALLLRLDEPLARRAARARARRGVARCRRELLDPRHLPAAARGRRPARRRRHRRQPADRRDGRPLRRRHHRLRREPLRRRRRPEPRPPSTAGRLLDFARWLNPLGDAARSGAESSRSSCARRWSAASTPRSRRSRAARRRSTCRCPSSSSASSTGARATTSTGSLRVRLRAPRLVDPARRPKHRRARTRVGPKGRLKGSTRSW